MTLFVLLFKLNIKFIYFFLKWLPTNNKKVVLISRQSNDITLDFKLLKQEILNIDSSYKIVSLCNKMNKSFKGLLEYYIITLKHLYHLATSRICVIDSYCLAVSIPKHKKKLTVIQIWHAIATVKKFGYQTLSKKYGRGEKVAKLLNMHKNYDWVISGSDDMVPIFSKTFNIEKSKIKSIGTPRIDYLINHEKEIKKNILKVYPNINNKKVILYAPTFRKDKNINLDRLLNTIDFNKYNLIVKHHPVKKQTFKNSFVKTCPEFSALELLTISDYVITDYSAISVEAAILNKPVYFYVYDYVEYKEKNGLNINLYKEMKKVCYKNFKQLYKNIDVGGGNYDYHMLERYKNKYVSNQNGNSGHLLANYIVNGIWE